MQSSRCAPVWTDDCVRAGVAGVAVASGWLPDPAGVDDNDGDRCLG